MSMPISNAVLGAKRRIMCKVSILTSSESTPRRNKISRMSFKACEVGMGVGVTVREWCMAERVKVREW